MSTELDLSFLVEAFDAPDDMDALAGVLFAEDFDLADPPASASPAPEPAAPEPEALPPAYDESQIHAARLLGYEDGRRAALAEATARAQLAQEAALLGLSSALADARTAAQTAAGAAAQASARTMLDLLASALPEFCARHGTAEAHALADALLPMLVHQPSIFVRANPHTLRCLEQVAAQHQRDKPDRISLVATDAMPEGDLAIEWQDGSAARDTTTLRKQLMGMLAPLGLAEPQASTTQKELANVG